LPKLLNGAIYTTLGVGLIALTYKTSSMESFQLFGSQNVYLTTFTKETLSNVLIYSDPLAIKVAATTRSLNFGLKLPYPSLKDGLNDIKSNCD